MRLALLASLALVLLLPLVVRATNDPCGSDGQPALGIVQVTDGSPDGTVYVDDRGYLENGVWLYAESNAEWTPKAAGVYLGDPQHVDLQRGAEWCDDGAGPCFAPDLCWDEASNLNGPDQQLL